MEISVEELRARLDAGDDIVLVDVREPWEAEICLIPGSRVAPLGTLPGALANLPRDRRLVTICHHGMRSLHAAQYLLAQGYDAVSLAGGVDDWAARIDPEMARY